LARNIKVVARREQSQDSLICVYNSFRKIPFLLWLEPVCSLFWFDLGNFDGRRITASKNAKYFPWEMNNPISAQQGSREL